MPAIPMAHVGSKSRRARKAGSDFMRPAPSLVCRDCSCRDCRYEDLHLHAQVRRSPYRSSKSHPWRLGYLGQAVMNSARQELGGLITNSFPLRLRDIPQENQLKSLEERIFCGTNSGNPHKSWFPSHFLNTFQKTGSDSTKTTHPMGIPVCKGS